MPKEKPNKFQPWTPCSWCDMPVGWPNTIHQECAEEKEAFRKKWAEIDNKMTELREKGHGGQSREISDTSLD